MSKLEITTSLYLVCMVALAMVFGREFLALPFAARYVIAIGLVSGFTGLSWITYMKRQK